MCRFRVELLSWIARFFSPAGAEFVDSSEDIDGAGFSEDFYALPLVGVLGRLI